MSTLAIYGYLFIAAALYAVLLAKFRKLWEPDLTWLEVVAGTALCLLAPYLDQRYNGPLTSELYEQRVWMAFLIGGLPIVAWQLGQVVRAKLHVEREIRGSSGDTTEGAAQMADARGEHPNARD